MKNTYRIIWSIRAHNNLEIIISYLEKNWTEKEIKKFVLKLDRCLNILVNNPEAFPLSRIKHGLRRVVITKQNTLFYSIKVNNIFLVNIFDTRQNPKNI